MGSYTKFYFRPGQDELIETIVHMQPDTRSSIHGFVRESDGRAIPDALVMLFLAGEDDELAMSAQTVTDELGQFMFGPLNSGQLYMIKVYKNSVKIRELQIRPE